MTPDRITATHRARLAYVYIRQSSPHQVTHHLEAEVAYRQAVGAERRRWEQKVERGRYEADLARRLYEEVDPANRLVARELERRWKAH